MTRFIEHRLARSVMARPLGRSNPSSLARHATRTPLTAKGDVRYAFELPCLA